MRPAILLFIALILSACASIDDSKKAITLDSALRQYEQAIRWGEYGAADSYRRLPAGSATTPMPASIKVTGYDTVNLTESADHTEVEIDVRIHYYNEYTMKEVSITDHQSWKYDPAAKTWYITSPMPAFR